MDASLNISLSMPLIISLLTLLGAVVLLVGNFLRGDLVAVLIILVLMLSGVLSISDALSGFSSHAVIIIASMFIIGEAIIHTGIAQAVGEAIIRLGGDSETRLLAMIMGAAGLVGAFMSSTATAAIFIPITLAVAEKANIHHRRLLMPLAVASLISGMMTLVATTPNIIVNNILLEAGYSSLSFFSFTPFGVLILLLSFLFMALGGQNILASKSDKVERKQEPGIDDLLRHYQIAKHEYLMRIPGYSPLVNRSIAHAQLGAEHHVFLLALRTHRDGRSVIVPARPEVVFQPGDLLMLVGSPENAQAMAREYSLDILGMPPGSPQRKAFFKVVGVAEVMLTPDSRLLDKSIKETQFQSIYHSLVLGIRRKGVTLTEDIADEPLKFGDVLLVCGSWKEISRLRSNREQYLLLTMPKDYREYVPGRRKRGLTLGILTCMVALMVSNLLPPVSAILSAATALLLTRCVPMKSVYTVIDWPTLVLIAGILPLALALQQTGAIALASGWFMEFFAGSSPLLILAGLFLFTAVIGLFMSNVAVVVLVAPMGMQVGISMGIDPHICVMMVALACSAAFVSPLGSAVNLLVREPGGYSFADFFKVGLPLLFLSLLASLLLAWVFYL